MMLSTKADGPSIRGFEPRASVGATPNMSAFDRPRDTAGYAAVMFAHPGTVSGTLAAVRLTSFLALKPVR